MALVHLRITYTSTDGRSRKLEATVQVPGSTNSELRMESDLPLVLSKRGNSNTLDIELPGISSRYAAKCLVKKITEDLNHA